jgi:hemerythrin-like domain-containing protein
MSSPALFNPTDKKYQVSEDFPPNKESAWPHPKEDDGWMHAHNALRMEMKEMVECVQAASSRGGSIKTWEAKCIQKFWDAHLVHVKSHHINEDAIFVPFLKTRLNYPEKCEKDHEQLHEMLIKLDSMVKGLGEGSKVDDLSKLLQEYESSMGPHLVEEEEECLPLMRAYFTPQEVSPKLQEIIGKGPKIEVGSFIAAMGQDTFRHKFMIQEGIPFFVWYIDFQFRLDHFVKHYQDPIAAVKNNREPTPPRSWCC